MSKDKHIIIGITGASGAIYGISLLKMLKETASNIKTHLIISKAGQITIAHETNYKINDLIKMSDYHHNIDDISCSIASGSFKSDGMVIAPCSVKTMSEIASGVTNNIMSRSADVILKERRQLVLMVRETPLHYGHLSNMAKLAQIGAIIAPPVPAFYNQPKSLEDIVKHSTARIIDLLGIEHNFIKEWQGINKNNFA